MSRVSSSDARHITPEEAFDYRQLGSNKCCAQIVHRGAFYVYIRSSSGATAGVAAAARVPSSPQRRGGGEGEGRTHYSRGRRCYDEDVGAVGVGDVGADASSFAGRDDDMNGDAPSAAHPPCIPMYTTRSRMRASSSDLRRGCVSTD